MVGCQSVIMWLLRCSEVFLACYYAVARVFWIVGRVLLCVLSVLTWLCSYKGVLDYCQGDMLLLLYFARVSLCGC